jgi:dephospho-CoA kinase
VVALTGGIGSGKTSVSTRLASLGAAIIDTDSIAHALTAPGGAAMPVIAAAFGAEVVASDGSLDRPAMRRRVFANASVRQRLEAILHPLIRARLETELHQVQAPYAVVVIPLLFETGWTGVADRILVVDLPEDQQIQRVMLRNGLSAAEVRRIIATQASRATRRAGADDIIENMGNRDELMRQTEGLHQRYLRLAAAAHPAGIGQQ